MLHIHLLPNVVERQHLVKSSIKPIEKLIEKICQDKGFHEFVVGVVLCSLTMTWMQKHEDMMTMCFCFGLCVCVYYALQLDSSLGLFVTWPVYRSP